MKKKYADIRIELTVSFEADGETNLNDQAIDAVKDMLSLSLGSEADIEVVGAVRDTEFPA